MFVFGILLIFQITTCFITGDEYVPKFSLKSSDGWNARQVIQNKIHEGITAVGIGNVSDDVLDAAMRFNNYIMSDDSTSFLKQILFVPNANITPVSILKDFLHYVDENNQVYDDAITLCRFFLNDNRYYSSKNGNNEPYKKDGKLGSIHLHAPRPAELLNLNDLLNIHKNSEDKNYELLYELGRNPQKIDMLLDKMLEIIRTSIFDMKDLISEYTANPAIVREINNIYSLYRGGRPDFGYYGKNPTDDKEIFKSVVDSVYKTVVDLYKKKKNENKDGNLKNGVEFRMDNKVGDVGGDGTHVHGDGRVFRNGNVPSNGRRNGENLDPILLGLYPVGNQNEDTSPNGSPDKLQSPNEIKYSDVFQPPKKSTSKIRHELKDLNSLSFLNLEALEAPKNDPSVQDLIDKPEDVSDLPITDRSQEDYHENDETHQNSDNMDLKTTEKSEPFCDEMQSCKKFLLKKISDIKNGTQNFRRFNSEPVKKNEEEINRLEEQVQTILDERHQNKFILKNPKKYLEKVSDSLQRVLIETVDTVFVVSDDLDSNDLGETEGQVEYNHEIVQQLIEISYKLIQDLIDFGRQIMDIYEELESMKRAMKSSVIAGQVSEVAENQENGEVQEEIIDEGTYQTEGLETADGQLVDEGGNVDEGNIGGDINVPGETIGVGGTAGDYVFENQEGEGKQVVNEDNVEKYVKKGYSLVQNPADDTVPAENYEESVNLQPDTQNEDLQQTQGEIGLEITSNISQTNQDSQTQNEMNQGLSNLELVESNLGVAGTNQENTITTLGVADINLEVSDSNQGVPETNQGATKSNQGVAEGDQGVPESNLGVAGTTQRVADTNLGVADTNLGVASSNVGDTASDQGVVESNQGVVDTNQVISGTNLEVTKSILGVDTNQEVLDTNQGVDNTNQGVDNTNQGGADQGDNNQGDLTESVIQEDMNSTSQGDVDKLNTQGNVLEKSHRQNSEGDMAQKNNGGGLAQQHNEGDIEPTQRNVNILNNQGDLTDQAGDIPEKTAHIDKLNTQVVSNSSGLDTVGNIHQMNLLDSGVKNQDNITHQVNRTEKALEGYETDMSEGSNHGDLPQGDLSQNNLADFDQENNETNLAQANNETGNIQKDNTQSNKTDDVSSANQNNIEKSLMETNQNINNSVNFSSRDLNSDDIQVRMLSDNSTQNLESTKEESDGDQNQDSIAKKSIKTFLSAFQDLERRVGNWVPGALLVPGPWRKSAGATTQKIEENLNDTTQFNGSKIENSSGSLSKETIDSNQRNQLPGSSINKTESLENQINETISLESLINLENPNSTQSLDSLNGTQSLDSLNGTQSLESFINETESQISIGSLSFLGSRTNITDDSSHKSHHGKKHSETHGRHHHHEKKHKSKKHHGNRHKHHHSKYEIVIAQNKTTNSTNLNKNNSVDTKKIIDNEKNKTIDTKKNKTIDIEKNKTNDTDTDYEYSDEIILVDLNSSAETKKIVKPGQNVTHLENSKHEHFEYDEDDDDDDESDENVKPKTEKKVRRYYSHKRGRHYDHNDNDSEEDDSRDDHHGRYNRYHKDGKRGKHHRHHKRTHKTIKRHRIEQIEY